MDTKYFGFITILKKNGSISSRCPIISKEFNIGRSSNNDIRIYLDSVSNNHCTILFVDNKAYIRDRSKAGSTKVNGKHIGRNNFLLRESDEIDISDRKLIFNYASLSSKKSWIRTDCTALRTQTSSPLVNSKKPQTPSKNITTTPSKRSVHPPRTPIVETNNHISNESFEELKKKPCDEEVSSNKTKPELMKSFSVTSGQNIPVLNNSKTPRKSWKSNNMSSSCARILDILSTDRKKRDVTPEMNTSYRFLDEEVEYDSPIPICDQEDLFDESVNTNVAEVDSSKMSEKTLNNEDDVDVNWQPSSSIAVDSNFNIPESTSSTSRRETYSIEDGPKVQEQCSTPAPRRSILKCSKTAKTCRSRSNNRMVQFARLPKTDSKIKSTKFYSGNSFTVIDDKSADDDHSQGNQKDKSLIIEDNETDDLDGVRPLDTSVSSLMNSPILDQVTLNKSSSKRGSRGNKVMSLISSFEKRTNGSPIQNLKASDLLNMSVSRNEEVSLNKSPEDITCISQKSSTSLRRINLEDMFIAEDSMKNSIKESEDKSMIEGVNLNPTQNTETSGSINSLLGNTISKELSVSTLDSSKVLEITFETETILDDVKISDSNQSSVKIIVDSPEEEFAFASPLNINTENDLCNTYAVVNWSNQNSLSEKENSICEMINTTDKNASQVNEETPVFKSRQSNLNESKINETLSEENKNTSAQNKTIENVDLSNIIENSISKNDQCKDSSKISQNNDINKTNNDVQEDFTESIEHLNNLEIVQNNHNAIHSKTHISDKVCMSEMGYDTFDKLEDINSNEECSALIENNAANNLVENSSEEIDLDKRDDISKKTTTESSSNNHVLSPMENLNEKLIDSIESQLDIIHNGIDTSNSDKENSVGNISNKVTLSINEQPTTRENGDREKTQNASEVVIIDVNTVNKSVNNDDSKVYQTRNEASTDTSVENDVNHTENIHDIIEQTSNICVKASSPINLADTVGNVELSFNLAEPVGNIEPNIKHTLQAQMSISEKSPKHLEKDIEDCNLNKSVKLTKTLNENDEELEEDIEHLNTTDQHFEQTLNTSIGKPQYESTPWNGFKNSKLPFNSTTGIEESKDTIQDDISEDKSKQKKKGISTPLFDPDLWSQRMKDFNESVKKASVSETSNINAKPSSKVLFSESNQNISKELPEHESSMQKSAKRRLSKTNSVIQCPTITTCSPNSTTIAFDQVFIGNKRTTRSHNKSPEKTPSELENKAIKSLSTKKKSVKAKTPQINNSKRVDESVDNNVSSLRSSLKSKPIDDETSSDTHVNEKKLSVAIDATHLAEQHSSTVDNDSSIMNKEQNLFQNNSKAKSPSKVMNRPMDNKIINLESTTDTDSETTTSDSEIEQESKMYSSSSQVSNRNKSNNSMFQTFSPVATKTRRNLRTRTNRNETRKSVQKQKVETINSAGTSADSDSDQNQSNAQQISGQKLQEKKTKLIKSSGKITVQNEIMIDLTNDDVGKEIPINNDIHTSNKAIKNNPKADKAEESQKHIKNKTTQNVKTNAAQPRARITRSNTTLTDTNLPIINKIKTPSPIKYKNTKGVKKIQIKKSSVVKSNKKQQLAKRVQPLKQVSNNKLSETSEYETMSEADESIQKLSPSPTVTKIQKKSTLAIAPSKNSKKRMAETSDTVSQLGKGSRKRAADTSAISQPKAKGRKRDHASKVASTTLNRESLSPKEKSSPTTIKRTRNTSKTKFVLGSDTSLLITNEVKKDKTKSAARKSTSPKELITKRTRNISKTKAPASDISLPITIEIKKDKPKSAVTIESMSPKENTSPTTSKRTRNTSKTKVLASNISLPTTNEIKKDKLKSVVTFESTPSKEIISPTTSRRTRNISRTKVVASDISLSTTNEIKKDKPKSAVTFESTSPKEKISPTTNKRTRNTSKTTVALVSDTSLPITNEVMKDKPKSTERARAKKRELNPHDSSVDSVPIARKKTRKALADNKEPEVKKNNASISLTKSTKAQSTDTDDTEPNISTRVRFNKNVDTKSISPRPKKTTRNTKLIETDSETIPSRVLRVREKRK